MKLAVLIPAFNEEETIGDVILQIPKRIDGVNEIIVLVVDDGSKDRTAQIARDLGAIVVSHSINQGVGQSFQTGLKKALSIGADIMVNIDADGQFPPSQISMLIRPIIDGCADFVPSDRFSDGNGNLRKPENMPTLKFWGNKVMSNFVSMLSGHKFNDVSCGFRAYSYEAMLLLNLTGKFTYTQESFLDLSYKKLRIQPVPVEVRYFKTRKSKVANNLLRYTFQTLKIIIRAYRDYQPLRFFTYLGGVPFFIGAVCGLFSIVYYLLNGSFTPYKFVGFLGIYLVSLGILLWIVGFLADMFVRVRQNQEQILYYEKCHYFKELNQEQAKQVGVLEI